LFCLYLSVKTTLKQFRAFIDNPYRHVILSIDWKLAGCVYPILHSAMLAFILFEIDSAFPSDPLIRIRKPDFIDLVKVRFRYNLSVRTLHFRGFHSIQLKVSSG